MLAVSPGVYISEYSLDAYTPQLATAIFGVIGTATKGPVNEVTLITDEDSLISTFGNPTSDTLGLLTAIRYLRRGRQLKFVRVADYDVASSGVIRNDDDDADAIDLAAVSTGSWGNNIQVTVSAGSDAGTYKILVYYNGTAVEFYDLVRVGLANVAHINYISTRINGVSEYITVDPDTAQSTLAAGSVTLTGGDDGSAVSDSDFIGSAGTPPVVPTTGLQLFADPDAEDVDFIAIPENDNATIIAAMITLCESRADAIAIIQVPYGKSVQQAVAWSNGTGGGAGEPTAVISSSYASIWYPWVKVRDGYLDAEVWIPAQGHVAAAAAYTDAERDPWWSFAGLNRGMLTDVLDLEHSPTQGERDYMYAGGNVVNPIISAPEGIVLWGQRTAQRTATSTDRINVRRLVIYLRTVISSSARILLQEPNDEDTWSRFTIMMSTLCDAVKAGRGIYDYRVVCDATTNTPAIVARNEMHGKIFIQPTKTAEMITIAFNIMNASATFVES